MTIMLDAMPYLTVGVALYAQAAYLFRKELLNQPKAIYVRSVETAPGCSPVAIPPGAQAV